MIEIVELGASELDPESGALLSQASGAEPSDDAEPTDYGRALVMMALGLAARPAPADENGSAQGIAVQTEGSDGVLIGGHDPRAGGVYGELQPGETAMFATGKGFQSRALAKKKLFAIVVGQNLAIVVDGRVEGDEQIILSCPGGAFKISNRDGVVISDETGKACLQMKGGVSALLGDLLLGGRMPLSKVPDGLKIAAEFQKIAITLASLVPMGTFAVPYVPTPDLSSPVTLGS